MDAFAGRSASGASENGLQFTGHVLCEDTLCQPDRTSVGSAMRFYEHMQAPGMDLLTEHWREYDTAKQVASGGPPVRPASGG